jgi:hypothetical protein
VLLTVSPHVPWTPSESCGSHHPSPSRRRLLLSDDMSQSVLGHLGES